MQRENYLSVLNYSKTPVFSLPDFVSDRSRQRDRQASSISQSWSETGFSFTLDLQDFVKLCGINTETGIVFFQKSRGRLSVTPTQVI